MAGGDTVYIKHCPECHVAFETVARNKRFCDTCKAERLRAQKLAIQERYEASPKGKAAHGRYYQDVLKPKREGIVTDAQKAASSGARFERD